jgi:hypothetical protein
MEFLWRPNSEHLGRRAEIFTHIIYDNTVTPLSIEDTENNERLRDFIMEMS